MATMKKHIGKLRTTDSRCVVVYMQIPGDENYSLIVDTDSLPDNLHDSLFRLVDSSEASNEIDLGNLLGRRPSMEPGLTMLEYLHRSNRLRRVPVTTIVMYPFPNQPIPLEEIIKLNGGKIDTKMAPDGTNNVEKYNPYTERKKVENTQSRLNLATAKLKEAELLDMEANKKREEAYAYFPQLRPGYKEDFQIQDIEENNGVSECALSYEELGINPNELNKEIIIEETPDEVVLVKEQPKRRPAPRRKQS